MAQNGQDSSAIAAPSTAASGARFANPSAALARQAVPALGAPAQQVLALNERGEAQNVKQNSARSDRRRFTLRTTAGSIQRSSRTKMRKPE